MTYVREFKCVNIVYINIKLIYPLFHFTQVQLNWYILPVSLQSVYIKPLC